MEAEVKLEVLAKEASEYYPDTDRQYPEAWPSVLRLRRICPWTMYIVTTDDTGD